MILNLSTSISNQYTRSNRNQNKIQNSNPKIDNVFEQENLEIEKVTITSTI